MNKQSTNRQWVNDHPQHPLSIQARLFQNDSFIDTCCFITVERLKNEFAPTCHWILAQKVDLTQPLFVLEFGSTWDDADHAIIVYDRIYESMYQSYDMKLYERDQLDTLCAKFTTDTFHVFQWIPIQASSEMSTSSMITHLDGRNLGCG
jgi:hypothetical protein